jgi:methionine-rich copper-binding protein CopC
MSPIQVFKRFMSISAILSTVLLGPVSSAFAHTELVSTSPVADSDVNASQETIEITFSEPPLVDGAAIVVMNEAGDILDSPAPALNGSTLSIPWPADLTPGQVLITWRATAADGHVISDEFSFKYTAAAESGIAPSVSPIPTAETSATPEPMMSAFDTPVTTAIPMEATTTSTASNTALIIAIVALAGLLAVGLYLRRSK